MLKFVLFRKVITGHITIAPFFNFDPNYKPVDRDYYVIANETEEVVVVKDNILYTPRNKEILVRLNNFLRKNEEPVKQFPLI